MHPPSVFRFVAARVRPSMAMVRRRARAGLYVTPEINAATFEQSLQVPDPDVGRGGVARKGEMRRGPGRLAHHEAAARDARGRLALLGPGGAARGQRAGG